MVSKQSLYPTTPPRDHHFPAQSSQQDLLNQQQLVDLGRFAAMMVHELRSPLTTLMMGLTHARSLASQPRSRKKLELAIAEGDRLKDLINSILSYAKPQCPHLESLELNGLIQAVISQLRSMPAIAEHPIDFIGSEESLHVKIDRGQFKQILTNLINNACEATAPGTVISCTVKRSGARVRLEVQNPAPSLSEQDITRFTEPFYSTKPSGTGLGLAIVKQLVAANQGFFKIQADVQNGVRVCIDLPCTINVLSHRGTQQQTYRPTFSEPMRVRHLQQAS